MQARRCRPMSAPATRIPTVHNVATAVEDDVPPNAGTVAEILERVRLYVFRRRVRIKGYFTDFDKRNCGHCTTGQFMRAISLVLPSISEAEVAVLTDHFTEEGPQVKPPQVVSYQRFVEAVDEVFTVPNLEKRPDMLVPRPGSGLKCSFHPRPLSPVDEDRLQQVLERIALLVEKRGVRFRHCFRDCVNSAGVTMVNVRHSGKITPFQFCKHFPFTGDFPEADVKLLLRRYEAEDGAISFAALDKDVSDLISSSLSSSQGTPVSEAQTFATSSSRPERPASAGSCLQRGVSGNLRRPQSAFELRTHSAEMQLQVPREGVAASTSTPSMAVPSLQQQQAAGFQRSASEASLYQHLQQQQRPPTLPLQRPSRLPQQQQPQPQQRQHLQGQAGDTCPSTPSSMQRGPSPKSQQTSPSRGSGSRRLDECSPPATPTAALPQESSAAAGAAVAASRPPPLPPSSTAPSQHDRSISRLPPEQMSAGFASNSSAQADETRVGSNSSSASKVPLARRRPQSAPAGGRPQQPQSQLPREPPPTSGAAATTADLIAVSRSSTSSQASVGSSSGAKAVAKLAALVGERQIRIHDRFQDFDRFRKGVCTTSQLKTVFTVLRVTLEPAEVDALIEQYWVESIGGDGLINYRNLCSDISVAVPEKRRMQEDSSAEDAFAAVDTSGAELQSGVGVTFADPSGDASVASSVGPPNVVEASLGEELALVQELMRKRLRLRRFPIRTVFQDYIRKTRSRHLPKWHFLRVMDKAGFGFNEKQLNVVCKAYASKEDCEQINYLDFCADMERQMMTREEAIAVKQESTKRRHRTAETTRYFDESGCIVPLSRPCSVGSGRRHSSAGGHRRSQRCT
eukprot:TRINITY_DN11067_c0_g3_i1.p1 TRINITY_DN11067_c0_g3~~TRINITY_DN11067_c0_g3_i1.p1  ORF type:complete len:854 (-),score=181.43 TRINITY_DN11067_c0_g3_i1:311-2872(-)